MTVRRLVACMALTLPGLLAAQRNFDSVQVRTLKVANGVYMLMGAGGNIGVSAGADGVILVDDQFAPLAPKIRAAVAAIDSGPIRFILNTHWHWDHTGGNEIFGRSGVLIIAQDNVRRRMSVDQFVAAIHDTVRASPTIALPVVTFSEAVTFYMNGDSIEAFHVPPAHTDGDVIIRWRHANVIHAGDTFWNGLYPLIDLSSGGSVDGMVGAADRMLAIADSGTKIIPGHGPLGDRATLKAFRDMLATVRDRVRAAVRRGRTLDQIKAAKPTAEFDAQWGHGSMTADRLVEILFQDLSKR
ncbi:MAG TPA: MBL fold metallo-hydrolase [Gemmatimonadales bacterium]